MTNIAGIAIALKEFTYIGFQVPYLRLTLIHSKGQDHDHAQCWQKLRKQTLNLLWLECNYRYRVAEAIKWGLMSLTKT